MAATYVPISREEFEQWLASLKTQGSTGWDRVPSKAGMYLAHLSDEVSVLVSSSVGTADQAMAKDQGSMKLRLVARDNFARVLNKKDVGQGKFYRTQNWRDSLARGFKNLREAYLDKKEFYDRLAQIKDPVAYREGWIKTIKAIPGSDKDTFLHSLLTRLEGGGMLSIKQEEAIIRNKEERTKQPAPTAPVRPVPTPAARPAPPAPAKPVVNQDELARVNILNLFMPGNFAQSLRKWVLDARPLSEGQLAAMAKMEEQIRQWVANLGQNTQDPNDLAFLRGVYRKLRDAQVMGAEEAARLKRLLQVGGRSAGLTPAYYNQMHDLVDMLESGERSLRIYQDKEHPSHRRNPLTPRQLQDSIQEHTRHNQLLRDRFLKALEVLEEDNGASRPLRIFQKMDRNEDLSAQEFLELRKIFNQHAGRTAAIPMLVDIPRSA